MEENLEKVVEQKLGSAMIGREFWLTLEKEENLKRDVFILFFPEKETICNELVLEGLAEFFDVKGITEALVLSVDEKVCSRCERDFKKICHCRKISDEEATKLLAYYSLQEFTSKILIASLDIPEGRCGSGILGVEGITEREIVQIGILSQSLH